MAIVEWDKYALSKLGEITSSKRIFKKEYVEKGVPFYRTKEVKELANGNEIATELFISEERFNEIDEKFGFPKEGDILLTAIGTIGEIYVVKGHNKFYFKDGNVLWLKKFDSIDPYFLRYALIAFIDELQELSRGSTYNALPINKLKNHEIFVPPIPEQKRIVALLDTMFADLDQTRAKTEQNLKNARELFDSYLQQVFSQESEGWVNNKLGNVCNIISGGTPKSGVSEYWEGDVEWLTPKDMGKMTDIYASDTCRKITKLGLSKSSAKLIAQNSVILSTRAPIGHLAINTVPMATNQGCRGLVPKENLETKYLFYFLFNSVELLNDLGNGTTFKELSKGALENVSIPLPPISEQKIIVSKLSVLLENKELLEQLYQSKLVSLDELKKSILQKAFSGELTATAN